MPAAVSTFKLTKDYGMGRGIFDLDLEIGEQQVFGFLGPNGAGKTTTIRLLMGMIRASRGRAEIFGLDCARDAVAVKRLVGYLPGELPQFGGMTGAEIVTYLGSLRGGVDPSRVGQIAARLDLDLGRPFRVLSRGNKQKLGLLLAFMHHPRLLILDEPTSGLDPLNQQEFHRLVADARADGATVLLSSHILSEVEHICDRIGIVRAGRLVRDAALADVGSLRLHEVELTFRGAPPVARIEQAAGVSAVTTHGRVVRATVRGSFDPLLTAVAGTGVETFISREPSLEEVFLRYFEEPGDGTTP